MLKELAIGFKDAPKKIKNDKRSMLQKVLDSAAHHNSRMNEYRAEFRPELTIETKIFGNKRQKIHNCRFMDIDYEIAPRFVDMMNKPKMLDKDYRESQDSEVQAEREEAEKLAKEEEAAR